MTRLLKTAPIAKDSPTGELSRVTVRLPIPLANELRERAVSQDRDLTKVIIRILEGRDTPLNQSGSSHKATGTAR